MIDGCHVCRLKITQHVTTYFLVWNLKLVFLMIELLFLTKKENWERNFFYIWQVFSLKRTQSVHELFILRRIGFIKSFYDMLTAVDCLHEDMLLRKQLFGVTTTAPNLGIFTKGLDRWGVLITTVWYSLHPRSRYEHFQFIGFNPFNQFFLHHFDAQFSDRRFVCSHIN